MAMETVKATVLRQLAEAPLWLEELVRSMPEALRKRRPAPGKWSVHEHACHLAVVHPVFLGRLDRFESEPHPVFRPYLPGADDDDADALLAMDLAESLDRFRADREVLVSRLHRLAPEVWDRTADHGEYSHYSCFIMVRHLTLHDHFHGYRIEELVLRRDWS